MRVHGSPDQHPRYGRGMRRSGIAVSFLTVLAVFFGMHGVLASANAADPGAPAPLTAPTLSGSATVGSTLTASPGTWTPAATGYAFTWVRDSTVIGTTASSTRVLNVTDRNHRISVRVTASNVAGSSDPAPSAQSPVVRTGTLVGVSKPKIIGVRRWDHTLTASPGTTTPAATSFSFRWLRNGSPIAGATKRKYALTVADFGARINLRVTARRSGFAASVRASGQTATIGHRVPVRRTFTYSIATRGAITADTTAFARLAAQTFNDPRGWRAAGYAFRRVAAGGNFTLYLAAAGTVPGFGYPCSSMWSCRVGNNVIINQTRWQHASPAWNAQHLPLRDYRHMVIDHETGHWLGHRHSGCPGKGRLAPVMMQQSKGLNGCRFNPFPLPGERWTNR